MYEYNANIIDVYDGDSVTAIINLGFNISITMKLRLNGIDTPEIRTRNEREKAFGFLARSYLRDLILGKDVIVNTNKAGKYGRYLADIYLDGELINTKMIEKGFAKLYFGGKKKTWFND